MPSAAKETIRVSALSETCEPTTITIGITAESSRAYGGTWRVSENRRKRWLPGIISSRA